MADYNILGGNIKFIETLIAKARKAFSKKNFKTSLEIYNSIE